MDNQDAFELRQSIKSVSHEMMEVAKELKLIRVKLGVLEQTLIDSQDASGCIRIKLAP